MVAAIDFWPPGRKPELQPAPAVENYRDGQHPQTSSRH